MEICDSIDMTAESRKEFLKVLARVWAREEEDISKRKQSLASEFTSAKKESIKTRERISKKTTRLLRRTSKMSSRRVGYVQSV